MTSISILISIPHSQDRTHKAVIIPEPPLTAVTRHLSQFADPNYTGLQEMPEFSSFGGALGGITRPKTRTQELCRCFMESGNEVLWRNSCNTLHQQGDGGERKSERANETPDEVADGVEVVEKAEVMVNACGEQRIGELLNIDFAPLRARLLVRDRLWFKGRKGGRQGLWFSHIVTIC
jgi:hypothetical protein